MFNIKSSSTGLGIDIRDPSGAVDPQPVTPDVGFVRQESRLHASSEHATLFRHRTLLTLDATPGRNAAELKSILGSSKSRLKSGAALLPVPERSTLEEDRMYFERAKSRARVEVDVALDSNTCVQGGYLQGLIKIRISRRTKKEPPIMISDGKVRVVGFESISNERDRCPFYQCSSHLSAVAVASETLYESQYDVEGFALAKEGEHSLPFSMHLPLSAEFGIPKGVLSSQLNVAVRYIAMVSIKVKDFNSNMCSVAHFYRNCEIWPRMNPSVILAPAERPLQATAIKNLFKGGNGRVELTASLHRLYWIAGQQCWVRVNIFNDTKKVVENLTLSLVRSTTIFKPDHRFNTLPSGPDEELRACRISTSHKQVAESVLEMGQPGLGIRGRASARGWWTGVGPGERLGCSHFLLLPSDALSVSRSRLLEVSYSIRVTLSTGTLQTTDVQVMLPICVVNFLSVDPPPTFSLFVPDRSAMAIDFGTDDSPRVVLGLKGQDNSMPLERLAHMEGETEYSDANSENSNISRCLAERDNETLSTASEYSRAENASLTTEDAYDGIKPDDNYDYFRSQMYMNPNEVVRELSTYEDDADDIARLFLDPEYENAPHFSDLYYASIQNHRSNVLDENPRDHLKRPEDQRPLPTLGSMQERNTLRRQTEIHEWPGLRSNSRLPTTFKRSTGPRGPSTFAQRIQEKIEAAARKTRDDDNISKGDIVNGSPASKDSHQQESRCTPNPMVESTLTQGDCFTSYLATLDSLFPQAYTCTAPPGLSRNGGGLRSLPEPPTATHLVSGERKTVSRITKHRSLPIVTEPDLASLKVEGERDSLKPDTTYWSYMVTRPSILALQHANHFDIGGSASSVKKRVRELEEKQRLLAMNEP